MNKYKRKRQEFFHRYFNYPSKLDAAIKKSEPVDYFKINISGAEIYSVRNIDNTKDTVRLLNKNGYMKQYNWGYSYRDGYYISDWASLFWVKDAGLFIHFEWQTYDDERNGDCLEMNKTEWDFFYSKRRIIFLNFYPSSLLKFVNYEDFVIQLTDNSLNRMVEWS